MDGIRCRQVHHKLGHSMSCTEWECKVDRELDRGSSALRSGNIQDFGCLTVTYLRYRAFLGWYLYLQTPVYYVVRYVYPWCVSEIKGNQILSPGLLLYVSPCQLRVPSLWCSGSKGRWSGPCIIFRASDGNPTEASMLIKSCLPFFRKCKLDSPSLLDCRQGWQCSLE